MKMFYNTPAALIQTVIQTRLIMHGQNKCVLRLAPYSE